MIHRVGYTYTLKSLRIKYTPQSWFFLCGSTASLHLKTEVFVCLKGLWLNKGRVILGCILLARAADGRVMEHQERGAPSIAAEPVSR